MKILITGTAGFIGFHLAKRMVEDGHIVIGLDKINDSHDVDIKLARLEDAGISASRLEENRCLKSVKYPNYIFYKINIVDADEINKLFNRERFDCVCNLAAQSSIRSSIMNPKAYVESNITGFANILEACRHSQVKHLVYASSSSVYGANETYPFSTKHNVDHPINLYAASKKSNELMAHSYSHLFKLPTTGLRFFTVYGPWGRPNMAAFLFADAILKGKPIDVFNNGLMSRDFTYIDDVIEGLVRVINKAPESNTEWSGETPDPSSSKAPYKIYNIGNGNPVKLMNFVEAIENNLNIKALINFIPIQAGEALSTCADINDLENDFNFKPSTSINDGINNFILWLRTYNKN